MACPFFRTCTNVDLERDYYSSGCDSDCIIAEFSMLDIGLREPTKEELQSEALTCYMSFSEREESKRRFAEELQTELATFAAQAAQAAERREKIIARQRRHERYNNVLLMSAMYMAMNIAYIPIWKGEN